MPKAPYYSAGERVDIPDFDQSSKTFTQEMVNARAESVLLDKQSRIVKGFRIEQADQNTYPGRITIHGGMALDRDGELIFDENQLNVSRTITLEGTSQDFYVEIEFNQAKSDVDARAFWDPTVDQGTDPSLDERPDGQEVNTNVATRTTWGWSVSLPISNSNFERDLTPSSTKIPLVKLTTDSNNKITGTTASTPVTTLLEVISATQIRVQDAQLIRTGTGSDLTISAGTGVQESGLVVSAVDIATGFVTLSSTITTPSNHVAGAIVEASGSAYPVYIDEADYGRYRRASVGSPIDFRDKFYQGDEIHGEALAKGHNSTYLTERSDVNLQAHKDHIDFLAAQIQEMKWGIPSPYTGMTSSDRDPAGIDVTFPTTPRYWDRAGGIQGARAYTVTVGDGSTSFGDFNAADETAVIAAVAALPSSGGSIFVKKGTYTFANAVTLSKDTHLYFEDTAVVKASTASAAPFEISHNGSISFHNMYIERGTATPSDEAIATGTTVLSDFLLDNCYFQDTSLMVEHAMPANAIIKDCTFVDTATSSTASVQVNHVNGSIGGKWLNCSFESNTNGSVRGVFGSVVRSFYNAHFKNCTFTSASGSSPTQFDLGDNSYLVTLENCQLGGNITYHVYGTSGSHIKLINCFDQNYTAGQFWFDGMNNITIDGLKVHNTTAPGSNTLIYMVDCTDCVVKNCELELQSSTSLAFAMLYLDSFSGYTSNITVENNLFLGYVAGAESTARAVGIYFNVGSGTGFQFIKVRENTFKTVEVGIFIQQSSGTNKGIYDSSIVNNKFMDTAGGSSAALVQKFGILGNTISDYERLKINGNTFFNCNPATTNVLGGVSAGRAAIAIETFMTQSEVKDNIISNIGDSANEVALTAGILILGGTRLSISGNNISGVDGLSATGLRLTDTTLTGNLSASTVDLNTIYDIDVNGAGGDDAFGIYINRGTRTTVSRNNVYYIQSGGSGKTGYGIAMGFQTAGNSQIINCTVSENSIDDVAIGIASQTILQEFLKITGNTIGNGSLHVVLLNKGIWINVNVANSKGLDISDNSVYAYDDHCIHIEYTFDLTNVTINNNNLELWGSATDKANVRIEPGSSSPLKRCSISDNVMINTCSGANARNIRGSAVEYITITGNSLNTVTTGNSNILLSTLSDKYLIKENICDRDGGSGTIITSATASTGGSVVVDNLVDSSVTLNAGNDQNTTGNHIF